MVDYLEPQQDFLAELAFSFEQQDFSLPQQDFLLQLSSEASGAADAEPPPPQPALAENNILDEGSINKKVLHIKVPSRPAIETNNI